MTFARLNSRQGIPLKYANRHGLITGQTGTGKSVSLMRLAEQFSMQCVPVFVSDVKGDLGALARSCPVAHLDPFSGLSVTVDAMGADLMARALELTDTQAGCLEIAFAYARDKRTPMATLDDLRAVLGILETDSEAAQRYGRVSSASVAVIMRAFLRIEAQGGNQFFRAPCFDVAALLEQTYPVRMTFARHDAIGRLVEPSKPVGMSGLVSILDSVRVINSPRVYSALLLWLLSDLWERLPEIGDCDKPRLVFFFDEAHLLFQECPAALLRRIEQTVRLIRSKGVGIYFVSQRPDDVPEIVRSQLAFRLEHSRAYRLGQAGFTGIDQNGRPMNAGVVKVDLPECPLGALTEAERPAVPEPETVAPAAGQFDRAGYVFLLIVIIAAIAISAGLTWIYASGKLITACAVTAGVFLAIRKKL